MSWNNSHEQIAINLGEQCAGYQWMLTKTTQDNLLLYRIIGLSAIPFSILSGTGYFAVDGELRVQDIIFGIFGVIAAILLSIQQFLNFRDNNQQYISLANKFQEIYNNITLQLAEEKDKREPPNTYISNMIDKFNIICDSRPVIHGYIARQYRDYLRQEGIEMSVPDVVGTVRPIRINNESNNNRLEEIKIEKRQRDPVKEKYEKSVLNRISWMNNP